MRTKLYRLASILMGGMLFSSMTVHAEVTNRASLVCLEAKYNFGQTYQDSVVRHSFVLTNEGSRLVRIVSVHSTCGCSTASVTTNAVGPGRTAELKVEITLKGRRGHQERAIYVQTDDPENLVLRLEFSGIVMVPIEAQPEGIHFGTVGAEGTLEREVVLSAVGTNEFRVRSVSASSSQISAQAQMQQPGKRYLIKIVSDGPRSYGSTMTSVRVETDHPAMPTIDIPVAAFVVGDIVPAPGTLILVPSATNAPRASWVNLWSPSGKAFKVTKVECPGAGMSATVNGVMRDRSRIEVKSWGPLTELNNKSLRVETDLPTMREIFIPVRVLSLPGKQPITTRP